VVGGVVVVVVGAVVVGDVVVVGAVVVGDVVVVGVVVVGDVVVVGVVVVGDGGAVVPLLGRLSQATPSSFRSRSLRSIGSALKAACASS